LPESLARDKRAAFSWAGANLLSSLRMLFGSRIGLGGLSIVLVIYFLAQNAFNSIFQLYVHHQFGWDVKEISIVMVTYGSTMIIVQSFLAGASARWFGERNTTLIGLAIGVVGNGLLALSSNMIVFWTGLVLMPVSAICLASIQSLMTQRVGDDEQGRL